MKTIKIRISGSFQDGYLYGGQLFLIRNSGELCSISLWEVILKNIKYNSDEYHFFRLIFTQNNWLNSEQTNTFLHISQFRQVFDQLWKKFSKMTYDFVIEDPKDLQVLDKLGTMPTLDMKIYGMRLFIGNTSGLYESGFSISDSNEVRVNKQLNRVFDARVCNIAAKSGSVMISSNSDGLFHGQLIGIQEKLQVKEKAISEMSIRSGWSGYDVVNYENQHSFNYLKSEFSKTTERQYLYKDESDTKKISIDKVGTEIYSSEELLTGSKFSEENIIYSFNSSGYSFLFLEDGSLYTLSFKKESQSGHVRLSSRSSNILLASKNSVPISRPISSKVIPNGCVIEYFDKVVLIYKGTSTIIENNPVISYKTYPSSIRYKNVISVFDGEGVSIHSLYPF